MGYVLEVCTCSPWISTESLNGTCVNGKTFLFFFMWLVTNRRERIMRHLLHGAAHRRRLRRSVC